MAQMQHIRGQLTYQSYPMVVFALGITGVLLRFSFVADMSQSTLTRLKYTAAGQ